MWDHCFTPAVDCPLPCRVFLLLLLLSRLLMRHNGRLMMTPVMTASALCTAVYDGDMPLLRRLLHAGANPNAGDYDKRTALHIAAADGNLPAVSKGGCCGRMGSRWLAVHRTAPPLHLACSQRPALSTPLVVCPPPAASPCVAPPHPLSTPSGEDHGGCGWCQSGGDGQVGADTTGRGKEGGGNASSDVPAGVCGRPSKFERGGVEGKGRG